eukprot:m.85804 g.85804  ORF g.85804 m.85804 type:complete len:783 (+) comp14738_c0_seq2:107-2455(+)
MHFKGAAKRSYLLAMYRYSVRLANLVMLACLLSTGAVAVVHTSPVAIVYNTSTPALLPLTTALIKFGYTTILSNNKDINNGSLNALTKSDFFVVPDATQLSLDIHIAYQRYASTGGNIVILGGSPPTMALQAKYFSLNVMLDREVYQMTNTTFIKTVSGNETTYISSVPWQGVSALAFETEGDATYVPLLQGFDHYNRSQGWVFARMQHNSSRFGQATWLLCGISSPSFYTETDFLSTWLVPTMAEALNRSSKEVITTSFHPWSTPAKAVDSKLKPITIVNGHLSYSNGSRYFMVGSNFYRSFRNGFGSTAITANFARAASLGLNTLRLFSFEDYLTDPVSGSSNVALLRKLAHSYAIRCIVTMDYDPKVTPNASLAQITAKAALLGQALRNEDWVLAYDLGNEPYFWELGRLRVNDSSWMTLHDQHPYDQHGNASLSNYMIWLNPGFSSMFQNVPRGLPVPSQYKPAINDMQAIYAAWITAKQSGLRRAGDHHMTTVGYNTVWNLLPCNKLLNFTNHHVYPNGPGYHTFSNFTEASYLPTTIDRLQANWDALNLSHPVTIGEFGTSDGDDMPCSSTVQHGCTVSLQETTTYDSLLWLTVLSSNADGGNRWRMNDLPVPLEAQLDKYIGNISDPTTYLKYRQEAYFGLAADDSTEFGILKPIAMWIRFFTSFLKDAFPTLPKMALTTHPANTSVRLGYTCQGAQAMFASGYSEQHTNAVSYRSETHGTTSVGAYTRRDRQVAIMATADTVVNVTISYFCINASKPEATFALLAGQEVLFSCE